MPPDTVGVVGLGRMSGNMARRLLDAGFAVVGMDVSDDALADFAPAGGEPLSSPRAVAAEATVEAVYNGADGLFEGATADLTVLETSSIDPDTMASLAARAADREVDVLGPPVSGGPTAGREGTLTVIVGGDPDVFEWESVTAVLDAIRSTVFHAGDVETGHTVKLLNNVVSIGNLLLATEALALVPLVVSTVKFCSTCSATRAARRTSSTSAALGCSTGTSIRALPSTSPRRTSASPSKPQRRRTSRWSSPLPPPCVQPVPRGERQGVWYGRRRVRGEAVRSGVRRTGRS